MKGKGREQIGLVWGIFCLFVILPCAGYGASPVYHRTYCGSEFLSQHSDLTYAALGQSIYATALVSGFGFRKVLDLPDGAEISRIDFYVVNNSPTNLVDVQLFQSIPSNNTEYFLRDMSTSLQSPNVQTLSMTGNPLFTLDTSTSTYFLQYVPGTTGTLQLLVGAHVEFTLPILYLPTIVIQ